MPNQHYLWAICFLLSFLALFSKPAVVSAAPLAQTGTVTLTISNESEQTICNVYISAMTADNWGENWLGNDTIAPGETYEFSLAQGDYDVLLEDCDDNLLLDERRLPINRDYDLSLTQVDVSAAACDAHNQQGLQTYGPDRYEEALAAFQAALACYQVIGDRAGEGTTLNNVAAVYRAQGRYGKALETYEAALGIAQEVDDRTGEGTMLSNIGVVYQAQGRYDEALEKYEAALVIAQEVDDRTGEGTTLNNIGVVYQAQGRYSEALEKYEAALVIRREVDDRAGEGTTLNNIAAVYQAQGHYAEALKRYEATLVIRREVDDRAGEGTTLNNIGEVYWAQGRYAEALGRYEAALVIRREVGDRAGEGITLNDIGLVYRAQGRYAEALGRYEAALVIRREVGDRSGEGITLNNIAVVYRTQGHYAEAQERYEAALGIQREVGDRSGEGITLNNIGEVYDTQGHYAEALGRYEAALKIAQEVGDRAGEGITLNNIAAVYQTQGRYAEALGRYEAALKIRREVGDRAGEGITLNNIGLVHKDQGDYTKALQAYMEGVDALERVRITAGSDQARLSFVNSYAFAYDRIIELLDEHEAVTQAFWYSERGRARVLLDTMATGQVQLNDNTTAELLVKEQEAYAVRQAAQDALAKARAANQPDPTWVSQAEAALQAAEVAYKQAAAAITARSDQLASLVPGRQQVPQLTDVQALLPANTTLLSYWTLEDKTLAFVITAQEATIVELPGITVQSVLTLTENLYQWRNRDNPHPLPLRRLYQALVAPLADRLKTSHVAIIPHQSLHYVPFAALTDGEQYFGQQYLLTLLPSASVLPFLAQNAANVKDATSPTALIFGNPQTDLPALPAAEAEASAVAALFQTTVYTGAAASEAQLRTSIQHANIVHLAAHSNYNLVNPLYSAIALASGEEQDGLLETREIFGLPLQGNSLVVLSACETTVNDLAKENRVALSRGDELVSLTRAFFFAGTPTVISSLWSVDDAATEKLMVSFYTHWLQEGMSKAEALQAAQADVRSDSRWVSPFYWAGFVLNGDPGQRNHASSPARSAD